MATIKCKGLTGVTFDLTIADMGVTTMNGLTALAQAIEGHNITVAMYGEISAAKNPSINQTNDGAKTLTAAGLVDGDIVICTPADDPSSLTKEERADQKLYIAEAKRRGLAAEDTTTTYYRTANIYDKTTLPNPYENDAYNVDDDENTGPLVPKRPWDVGSIAAPLSIEDAVQGESITDLEIWYDGADTNTIVPTGIEDEDLINQWNDKSGLAHNLNFSGGNNKPSYESSDTQNGYGYIQFADGDLMSINPLSSLSGADDYTVFVIARATSLATNSPQLLTSTENGELSIQIDSDGTARFKVGAPNATTAAGTVVENEWFVFTLVYDGNSTSITGRVNDGKLPDPPGQTITITTDGTAPATLNGGTTYLYVGGDNTGGTFIGDVGEVILFKKALTATEYANVENYLTTKWGI
jgi:hypothetical protein